MNHTPVAVMGVKKIFSCNSSKNLSVSQLLFPYINDSVPFVLIYKRQTKHRICKLLSYLKKEQDAGRALCGEVRLTQRRISVVTKKYDLWVEY